MNNRAIAAGCLAASLLALNACGVDSRVDEQVDAAARQAEEGASSVAAETKRAVDEIEELTDTMPGPDAPGDAAPGQSLYDAAALRDALAGLGDAVGETDPQLTEVIVSADYVELMATDPRAREELNSWTYRAGSVGPFSPVDYGGDEQALKANLFLLSDVRVEAIVRFAKGAVEASGVEGGELTNIIVKRNLPVGDDIRMFANVTGERDSKQVRADVDGKVLEVV